MSGGHGRVPHPATDPTVDLYWIPWGQIPARSDDACQRADLLDLNSIRPPRGLPPVLRLRLQGLTLREAEAALLAGRGLLVREIAQQMQVAAGTVKTLLARAREKLGCRSVRELTAVLLRNGVVGPDELLGPREQQSNGP